MRSHAQVCSDLVTHCLSLHSSPLLLHFPQSELGKGAFQECDQVQAASGWVKYGGRASRVSSIGDVVAAANRAAMNGRPGAAYVDLPSNILLEQLAPGAKLVLPPVPSEYYLLVTHAYHVS